MGSTNGSSDRRKLALFLPDLPHGGVERRTCQLAGGLAGAGFDVDLVVADGSGPSRSLVPAAVRLVDLRRTRTVAALPALASYLRRNRPGALIAAKDHANVVAALASATSGTRTPVIATVRSRPSDALRAPERRTGHVVRGAIKVVYPRVAAVVAVSEGVAHDLERLVPGLRVEVIGNPVVSDEVLGSARVPPAHAWLTTDHTEPVVMWCGRLSEEKDPLGALAAFLELRDRRASRFVVLGDGPLAEQVAAVAAASPHGESIHLAGYVDDPERWLARADAFLLSSRREGLPAALIEALAVGTPAVATDCPSGPREILDGGRLGPLVPIGDTQAMAHALEQVLDHPPERATADDLAPYTLEAAVGHYVALLEECGAVIRR